MAVEILESVHVYPQEEDKDGAMRCTFCLGGAMLSERGGRDPCGADDLCGTYHARILSMLHLHEQDVSDVYDIVSIISAEER